jgi:hypothetical protein
MLHALRQVAAPQFSVKRLFICVAFLAVSCRIEIYALEATSVVKLSHPMTMLLAISVFACLGAAIGSLFCNIALGALCGVGLLCVMSIVVTLSWIVSAILSLWNCPV